MGWPLSWWWAGPASLGSQSSFDGGLGYGDGVQSLEVRYRYRQAKRHPSGKRTQGRRRWKTNVFVVNCLGGGK